MEILLQNARWKIVQAISKKSDSATGLAAATSTSLPNVSQQLKLLEAYDIVEHERSEKKGVGKPRQLYRLKRPMCEITYVRPGLAKKLSLQPSRIQAILLNTLVLVREEDQACLMTLFLTHHELVSDCAIAYKKTKGAAIELLLLTDNLDHIRKTYSKISIEANGKEHSVISWTHSTEEIRDGLQRSDKHFVELMKDVHVIHDPNNDFSKVREESHE